MIRKAVLSLMLLAAFASAVDAQQQQPDQGTMLQRGSMSRAKGASAAPVLVYEIADFQCPFCAQFATSVHARIDSAFVKSGKVQWVYVNMPLPIHQNSWLAAEAAMCAGATAKRFWQMHDRLFATQPDWQNLPDPGPMFARYARESGVPIEQYAACVASDRMAPLILQDVVFAAGARVSGTPTFIVNSEETIVGVKSYDEWKDILEKAALKPRRTQ